MRKHAGASLALGLLLLIAASCNWPLDQVGTETAAPATSMVSPLPTATRAWATATDLPAIRATATSGAETPDPVSPVVSTGNELFGRSIHFDLPDGYRMLAGDDGGCFVYAESTSGFLILYPAPGDVLPRVTELLSRTPGVRQTETPLEVEIGGLTFTGLFVETDTGNRFFLAAAEGWSLVVQGPADGWQNLASGLNRVLRSISFEEEAR